VTHLKPRETDGMSDVVDEVCLSVAPFTGSDRVSQFSNDDNSTTSATSSNKPPFVKTTSTNSIQQDSQSSKSTWSDTSRGAVEGVMGTLRNSFRRLSHIGESVSDVSRGAVEGLGGTLRNSFRRLSHMGDSLSKRSSQFFLSIHSIHLLTCNL